MKTQDSVTLTAKCTTCRKTFTVTPAQEREARDVGCLFSPCCQAVATVEAVSVDTATKGRRK